LRDQSNLFVGAQRSAGLVNVAALIISCFSLVIASLALGWQIAQWLLSGGRAKATLVHGMLSEAGAYSGAVAKHGAGHNLETLRRQEIRGTEVLGVTVFNTGRLPVVVMRYKVELAGGNLPLSPLADAIGPQLPHKLEPGHSETWYVDMRDVVNLVDSSRAVLDEQPLDVYMSVQTGLGKTLKTRRQMKTSGLPR